MSNILVTTAISYTNGSPHIGHLYEAILADFTKHLHIIGGNNVKLLTGTDEHGKKIEETAKKQNLTNKELCDRYSSEFKELNNSIRVKYDHFIRTTDDEHITLVQESLVKVKEYDKIYLGKYKGWYNVREETYVSDQECKQNNYTDPVSGKPYELIEEESYYFRLSDYSDKLTKYIRILNIPSFLKDELLCKISELKDLSISRTSFAWGIKYPFDEKHIVYVWFDALLNYITGNKILFTNKVANPIHIIGKDIVWFHTVIYPAILYSLGLDEYITTDVFIHGFILDNNGNKMSKSLGNVIDVKNIVDKYNIEAIRYYLISNTNMYEDIKFSEELLVSQYNNELFKSFGNLFQRLFKLIIPHQHEINTLLIDKKEDIIRINNEYKKIVSEVIEENINIKKLMKHIHDKLAYLNKWIQDEKPWEKKGDDKIELLTNMIIELNGILIALYPIIPYKIDELRNYLGWEPIHRTIFDVNNLEINISNTKIKAFQII